MLLRALLGLIAVVAVTYIAAPAAATEPSQIPSYYQQLDFNLTSPSAFGSAVGGFANPAMYALTPGAELEYFRDKRDGRAWDVADHWGLFAGLRGLGFGAVYNRAANLPGGGELSVTDYRLALSGGDRRGGFGIAYGWSRGDTDQFGRTSVVQVGASERIGRYAAVGATGTFSTEKDDQSGLFDLAIRPLGDERLTVFGDFELAKNVSIEDVPWSAGAMLELVPGIRLTGRYFGDPRDDARDGSFALGFSFSDVSPYNGGMSRTTWSPRFDADNNSNNSIYGYRVGFPERNLGDWIFKEQQFVKMHLKGPIKHARYRYFDSGYTVLGLITALENARHDARVSGVAINLSGTRVSPGNAWELREKIKSLQNDGKKVIVYVDEASMTTYHLASVADHVVMDPEGMLILPGYALGRTFIKGTLDKLGIGFDEWRFLTYKSAVEVLSRESMSDADREQREEILDAYFDTWVGDVAASRDVSTATVTDWLNEETLFSPSEAVDMGVVDAIGRWDDLDEMVEEVTNKRRQMVGAGSLARSYYPSRQWGNPPQIAVVYALGPCAMDSGINARRLEATLHELTDNPAVKAVVLRVNSPGGSALASDLVVKALGKCGEKKPVVVSQADVAASGGYWCSMYADEIWAQPTTITGSIGVISGWVYDNGASEKIGFSGDVVQRGDRADLFFNIRDPLLGIGIPHRRLTDDERADVLDDMRVFYRGFVEKVAKGRDMAPDDVEKIAQGRAWSGRSGLKIGLVDRLGGLADAIDSAAERAGIDRDEVEIVERGTPGWFNLENLNPLPFRWFHRNHVTEPEFDLFDGYSLRYVRTIADSNGRPLCLLPADIVPSVGEGIR